LPLVEIVPGYSSRLADRGGMTAVFEKAHAGQDASSMVKGLLARRRVAMYLDVVAARDPTVELDRGAPLGARRTRRSAGRRGRRTTRLGRDARPLRILGTPAQVAAQADAL
jgi:hypothetical protein